MDDKAPFLFISHKHADRQIAQSFAEFIDERSGGKIKVHLSSSPDFQGPRFGPSLNAQLRDALWKTEVLILVYTSEDQDWSYCMWECGVALNPQSPDTTLIVVQCGRDVPSPFKDVLRVNPRNRDDLKSFVKQLLRDVGLFKSGAVLPGLKDVHLENLATDFHARLNGVLPQLDDGQVEEWPAWPFLRIELPRAEADKVAQATGADRRAVSGQLISDHAYVVRYDPRAAQLFGKQSFPARMKFVDLANAWKDKYPDGDEGWFDSCCNQITECSRRGFPFISSISMREIDGDSTFTPVVTRIQRLPFSGIIQFDIYFFNLSDPRAVIVTSCMRPIDDVFCWKISDIDPSTYLLKDIIEHLDANHARIPIVDSTGAPLYLIHKSLVTDYLAACVFKATGKVDPTSLTLADMLSDPGIRSRAEDSYALVSAASTLAEANNAMSTLNGCNDVFVTSSGKKGEPVLGLLTNNRIRRSL